MELCLTVAKSRAFGWQELVDEFLQHVQATKKPTTHRSYKAQLSLFERWIEAQSPEIEIRSFRPANLDAYLVYRQASGVSAITRAYDGKLVRMLLEYAYQQEYIARRPLRDYKIKKVAAKEQRCPTVEELQKFLTAIDRRWNPVTNPLSRFVSPKERRFYRVRDMALFTGLMETACRINELLALKIEDFDTAKMQFVVQETKGGKPRTIPFTQRWLACVQEWRKIRPRCDNDCLFISTYGETLNVNRVSALFRIYRDLAGLPDDLHLHSLRHYAITVLAETDVLAAKEIAGHKDLKTTQIYIHTQQERNRQKQADADPLGKILVNKRSEQRAVRRKLL